MIKEILLSMILLYKQCSENQRATNEFKTWFIHKIQWETLGWLSWAQ